MAARDELIKVGESLKVLQPMIDISADRLNGLRTQCATSVDLTRQEIRTLEGKLLKMFAQQLVIKSQLRGEAATVFRDVPSVRQWLQVVGLQKESIDGVCECVDSLEALQEKTDRDLSVILTERNAKRDEFRRLNHALFNLKRYTDILKRGDTNGDEPSDQALYWDSWDRQRGHKPSGGLSPHPSSRNRSEHIRQGGNLNDDVPSYEDDDGREYNSSDGSISSIASFVQSPPPTPPVITKSRVFGGTEKHKQPSTPPPHQKHRTGGRTNDVGLLPGSFPLTKSKSHESQLSARAPDESDSSRGPTRRGRLPTEPGFVSATNRGSNSPLDANSTGASVTESRTASPVPSPPPSIVMSCRPVVVRTPRCVVNERIACPTIRDIVIPPATSPVTCTSKTASPSTTPNHGFRDRDVPSTPGPITPRRTPSPNTPNAYSFVSPSTISPIASSPVGVSPSSLGPILCGSIATSPTATKRICGYRPSGAASPHTPRSKFADSSPATPRGSNSSGASPAFVSPVKSPATPGTDTEDVDGSQPSLRVPKSPHKTVIGTATAGGPGNVPRSMRHCIAHHFTKMYVMIERCDYCHRQMLFATGVRCKECKYMCHRECEEKVPPACGLPSELVDVFKWTISPGVPPSQSPNPGPTPTSSPNHHHSNPFVSLRKKERERKRPHPQPSINVAPFIGQDSSSNTSSCNSSTPSSPALLSVHTPLSVNMIHFNFPEVDRGITLETHPLEVLSETRTSNDSDKTTSACGSGSGGSGSTDSERTPVRVDSQESQVSDSEVVNERENQRWPRQNSQLSMREWDIPFDELKIGEPIGTGRFGTVYRGNWHGDVAIKVLNMDYLDGDKALEAFKSEVGTFRKTRHENLVLFMGACMNPPRLAIVTSLSKGMTLYTHVHLRKDKFNMNKATIVAQQICQGMGYLHARGIVHKDLKSKNIFLENGKVVITDFGLFSVTKLCFGDGESNSLNIPPGWLCYLAPEIVRSLRADQSHRHYELLFSKASDIYAFGTVWYELLCGEWPFKGQAPESVIWQVGKGMKQPLANLQASRDVKDILMLCWAFRPSDRKDFGELFNLLEKLPKKRLARSPSHPVHLSRSAESVF